MRGLLTFTFDCILLDGLSFFNVEIFLFFSTDFQCFSLCELVYVPICVAMFLVSN